MRTPRLVVVALASVLVFTGLGDSTGTGALAV